MTTKERLIQAILRRIDELEPGDAESHIWFNRFIDLINDVL
jgi:hypothetical protein